jgi:hypothetical protein
LYDVGTNIKAASPAVERALRDQTVRDQRARAAAYPMGLSSGRLVVDSLLCIRRKIQGKPPSETLCRYITSARADASD